MRVTELLPRWTKFIRIEESGRDPLGLARVHDRLTDWLAPGITTQTNRARYYSFYLWAIKDTNDTDKPTTRRQFVEGMRSREAAFVLACMAHHDGDNPRNLVGVEQGRKVWRRAGDSRYLPVSFRPLPSNPQGGYGQYYGGSLYRLGLTHTPEDAHGIDQLTPEGVRIAQAFAKSVDATAYVQKIPTLDDEVPRKVLEEYGQHACLCQLSTRKQQERLTLTNLFFGLGKNPDAGASLRRDTLLLCLDVIAHANKCKAPIASRDFDFHMLEQAVFFGQLAIGKKAYPYTPPPVLQSCAKRWRLFSSHRYCSHALQHLFAAFLEEMARTRTGLSVREFVKSLDWAAVAGCFKKWTSGSRSQTLAEWIENVIQSPSGVTEETSLRFDEKTTLKCGLNEVVLAKELSALSESGSPITDRVALALLLMFTLYCRSFHYRRGSPYWAEIAQLAGDDLWFENVAQRIEETIEEHNTMEEFLSALLQNEVIRQHDKTLYQRNNVDAPWFQPNGEKLVWQRDHQPNWGGSKMNNCLSILADLNLLVLDDEQIRLTTDGRALHAELLAQS